MATNYKEKLGNEVPARLSGRGQNPDENEVKCLRGYLAVGQNPDKDEVKCLRGYLAVGHNPDEDEVKCLRGYLAEAKIPMRTKSSAYEVIWPRPKSR